MSGNYVRYAIRWVPQQGTELAAFGRHWTGWCAETGMHADTADTPSNGIVGRACPIRHSGFGAIAQGPFRLAHGQSDWRLEEILMDLAETEAAVHLPRWQLHVLDGQVCLLPAQVPTEVRNLIQRVRARVRAIGKAADGIEPGFEPFRIPLSAQVDDITAQALMAEAVRLLPRALAETHVLSDLSLMGDPGGDRPWRLIERFPLCRDAARPVAGLDCPCQVMPPLRAVTGSNWDTVIA